MPMRRVPPVDAGVTPVLLLRLKTWQVERDMIEPGVYRSGHGYRDGMPTSELVDSTRAWWNVDPRRVRSEGIQHAIVVHDGLTRAVVTIGNWRRRADGRWAFSATLVTDGPVFEEWVGLRGVRADFARGDQNPVRYSTSL